MTPPERITLTAARARADEILRAWPTPDAVMFRPRFVLNDLAELVDIIRQLTDDRETPDADPARADR